MYPSIKLVELKGIAEQKQSGELFLPKSVAVVNLRASDSDESKCYNWLDRSAVRARK